MAFDNNFQRGPRRGRFLFFPFIAAAMALAVGAVVMLLWNHILPELLHLPLITYWQAVGLLVLCRILFGGFGRRGGGPGMRSRNNQGGRGSEMREKWMRMTHEERRRFKDQWRQRCQPRGDDKEQ